MKIHEVPEAENRATLCCGTFPSLLPSGDLVTEHAGIVTCDRRVQRCPDCNAEAGYIWMRTEPPAFGVDEAATVMKVDPCAHEFRVRIGIQDSRIRLEKRKSDERGDRRSRRGSAGAAEAGQPEEREEAPGS